MPAPLMPREHLVGPGDPGRRFRFMEVVRQRLSERRYATKTVTAYLTWIRRFIVFHGRRHPKELDATHVAAFLSDLAVRAGVSAATQNQALGALVFLFEGVLQRPLERVEGIRRAAVAICAGRSYAA